MDSKRSRSRFIWAVSSLKCNASSDDDAKEVDWEVALRSQQA